MDNYDLIPKKIGVLGAGTWGMALSMHLAGLGHNVTVWSALPEEIEEMEKTRIHPNLHGSKIPESIELTADIREALDDESIVLFAVPSPYIRETARTAASFIKGDEILVCVAKGIELETLSTMSEVIADELKKSERFPDSHTFRTVTLSGPTHAEEVFIGMPTAIVAASGDTEAAEFVQDVFISETLRVYTSGDEKGADLCGAMKNVIALAVGVSTGLGYGDNAMAALITRGMQEIYRLGVAMGCEGRTFYGLAGIGDLIVTATSEHSRNNRCGKLIGKGMKPEDAVKEVGMVVEGLNALPAMIALADKYGVDAPVARMLDSIVRKGEDPRKASIELMTRDKKSEY